MWSNYSRTMMFLSVLPVLLTALKRGRLPCNKVKTSYSSLDKPKVAQLAINRAMLGVRTSALQRDRNWNEEFRRRTMITNIAPEKKNIKLIIYKIEYLFAVTFLFYSSYHSNWDILKTYHSIRIEVTRRVDVGNPGLSHWETSCRVLRRFLKSVSSQCNS